MCGLSHALQVVSYEGELLMQTRDDDVTITLLRTSIPDSTTDTYIKQREDPDLPREKQKGKSFGDIAWSVGSDYPTVS